MTFLITCFEFFVPFEQGTVYFDDKLLRIHFAFKI